MIDNSVSSYMLGLGFFVVFRSGLLIALIVWSINLVDGGRVNHTSRVCFTASK